MMGIQGFMSLSSRTAMVAKEAKDEVSMARDPRLLALHVAMTRKSVLLGPAARTCSMATRPKDFLAALPSMALLLSGRQSCSQDVESPW